MHQNYIHKTVLKKETIESIIPSEALIKSLDLERQTEIIVIDATLGGGGHAEYLVELFDSKNLFDNLSLTLIAIDRDELAIENARFKLTALKEKFSKFNFHIYKDNFCNVSEIIKDHFQNRKVHSIYADFGVSSPQLDLKHRGFSFLQDGPVDMRMDPSEKTTARDILLNYSEAELEHIFLDYGEEYKGRKLAKCIVQDRQSGKLPLNSTKELAEYFKKILAYPPNSRVHPATRAFQALRIETNRELESIEILLRSIPSFMHDFGKAAFISFHSLEDRLVKRAMRSWQKGKNLEEGDKKPDDFSLPLHIQVYLEENRSRSFGSERPRGGIVPSEMESSSNPRARSARLRCFEFGQIIMD